MMRWCRFAGRYGDMWLATDGAGLSGVHFAGQRHEPVRGADWEEGTDALLRAACAQLDAYFAGRLREFDLPLAPRGTPFQQTVWRAIAAVPYGATAGYAELAGQLGRPRAARAVGAATGRNPLGIVIPCHRVVGAGGALTGYAGGLPLKRRLLALEAG